MAGWEGAEHPAGGVNGYRGESTQQRLVAVLYSFGRGRRARRVEHAGHRRGVGPRTGRDGARFERPDCDCARGGNVAQDDYLAQPRAARPALRAGSPGRARATPERPRHTLHLSRSEHGRLRRRRCRCNGYGHRVEQPDGSQDLGTRAVRWCLHDDGVSGLTPVAQAVPRSTRLFEERAERDCGRLSADSGEHDAVAGVQDAAGLNRFTDGLVGIEPKVAPGCAERVTIRSPAVDLRHRANVRMRSARTSGSVALYGMTGIRRPRPRPATGVVAASRRYPRRVRRGTGRRAQRGPGS